MLRAEGPRKQHCSGSKKKKKPISSLIGVGMRKPGVGVLVAYLGGHRRAVAGVDAVAAYGVDGVPHHGRHGGTGGEAPVCRVWQSAGEWPR